MARKKRKTRENRTVADRQESLEPLSPEAHFTLAGVRRMYAGMGGREFFCTLSGYCRTQIFEFPGIDFHPDGDESHHTIYTSPSVQACVASNLVDYFAKSMSSKHYAISPSLRHMISETDKKIKSQQKGRVPVFLVIEESNQLTPVEMVKGECRILDEIAVLDGEKVPMLVGGREGEEFIIASPTIDGAWPKLPNNNQQLVNMILAGVRVGQQTADPIRKYVDQNCLVTDDDRFVVITRSTMSARVSTMTPMDTTAYRGRAAEIGRAIAAMEHDIGAPHVALLIKSMYSDEYKDDAYQRLQYLRLWESLVEAGPRWLSYPGDVRKDKIVVAGNKTLEELADYRHDIAHWWTDTIDENYLVDLQRTINELIRRKYF